MTDRGRAPGSACWSLPNFAVEQAAGSHLLARGCSPRRYAEVRISATGKRVLLFHTLRDTTPAIAHVTCRSKTGPPAMGVRSAKMPAGRAAHDEGGSGRRQDVGPLPTAWRIAPPCRTQSVRLPSGRPLERRPGLIAGGVEPHADKLGQRYAVADICRFDRLATTIAGLPAASSDFTEPIRCRARQSTTSRLLYGQCRA